jgi:hypothetical protein
VERQVWFGGLCYGYGVVHSGVLGTGAAHLASGECGAAGAVWAIGAEHEVR